MKNNDTITGSNVVITHTLPLSVSFDSASMTPTRQTGPDLVWNVAQLAGLDSLNLTITGTVSSSARVGAALETTAVASADLAETDLANNTASFTSTVVPGPATELVLTAPNEVDLLAPFDLTVTARDAYGNLATGYESNVTLSTTDASTAFPASHRFDSVTDQGVYTFTNLFLENAGTQTITAASGTLVTTVTTTVDDAVVIIDQDTTWNETGVTLGRLVVTGTAILTLKGSTTITAEHIVIGENATISADGQGHPPGSGPGAGGKDGVGWPNGPAGSGGGYGGYGGGRNGVGVGRPYGSFMQPDQAGSGGGSATSSGGAGGGSIHLMVSDTLQIEGRLSANGARGAATSSNWSFQYSGGGGSGGSIIWLEAGVLAAGMELQQPQQRGLARNLSPRYGRAGGGPRLEPQLQPLPGFDRSQPGYLPGRARHPPLL